MHQQQQQIASLSLNQMQLPLALTTSNTIYGQGPLIYCVTCNENYSNEQAFIRHSYLAHLLDPNINLNWYKVYSPHAPSTPGCTPEQALQQIATAMALADSAASGADAAALVDANGQPIPTPDQQLVLHFECPLCFKSVQSKDCIQRHLLYHALNEVYEYDFSCSSCTKQLVPSQNLAECLLHTREFRSHRISVAFHKYILSAQLSETAPATPVVACVLCQHESANLIQCIAHIMFDHFSYDSSTIKIKRFVNAILQQMQAGSDTSMETDETAAASASSTLSPKSSSLQKSKSLSKFQTKSELPPVSLAQCNAELIDYFSTLFPAIQSELILQAATTKSTTARPDAFLADVKCFKCGKFGTKVVKSLFAHLSSAHGYELRELDKLYETYVSRQMENIQAEQLVDKYERQQRECAVHQQQLLKEKLSNEQIQKQQQLQQVVTQQQLQQQQVEQSNQQPPQQQTAFIQLQNTNDPNTLVLNQADNQMQEITVDEQLQLLHQQQLQQQQQTPTLIPVQQQQQPSQQQQQQQPILLQQTAQPVQQTHKTPKNHNQQLQQQQLLQQQPPSTPAQLERIQSTIDQVLSQICKEDPSGNYENKHHQNTNHHHHQNNQMLVDQQHQQQQIIQQPEAENLFVFKCNLCEPYATDDATALLDHYKLQHQVELTIADSSTLLAAAVAAFQTGHTIEMTGAILNTLSTVTDENGVTIISGEEVPVHTTVQYKCTLCHTIFYEKQYIVQHLYAEHAFEIDVSYFEEIEQQQQEQLQQKIYEQQQEQLMLQQQQQQQQQLEQVQALPQQVDQKGSIQLQHLDQQQAIPVAHQIDSQQQQVINGATSTVNSIHDETAAVMMMMMNGNQVLLPANQVQQLITTGGATVTTTNTTGPDGIPTAQLVLNAQGLAQLEQGGVVAQPLVATPVMQVSQQQPQQLQQQIITAQPVQQSLSATSIGNGSNKILFSCTYCTFGCDKLKKMTDHMRQNHPMRDKTCMDNLRQQLIRLPNEENTWQQSQAGINTLGQGNVAAYNQPPATVGALLNMHQQQMKQQTAMPIMNQQVTVNQQLLDASKQPQYMQQQVHSSPLNATGAKKRGPKPKGSPGAATTHRANTVANTLSRQQQQQQQQQQQNATAHIKNPTVLTMDANSQIIIDFNQNDELLCAYCDYTMNNLNYMRTHIKFKHKNMPITFQNKQSSRFYTIVEWPLTPVPTLTPATTAATGSASSTNTTATATTSPATTTNVQQQQQQISKNVNADASGSLLQGASSQINNEPPSAQVDLLAATSNAATTSTPASEGTQQPPKNEDETGATATATTVATTPAAKEKGHHHKKEQVYSAKVSGGSLSINTTNVNSILKKLGVNVTAGSTPLNNLISTIGSGANASAVAAANAASAAAASAEGGVAAVKNNSVVNVNINFLKDVNIDEMIDDDDDEERKFLIRELEKKTLGKEVL